jgi:4-hydroxyphenylpyruvate dioxygenase
MTEARPNPLGVQQFDFIEYAAPDASQLHELFKSLGFTAVAKHKSRPVTLYRQGDIDFLVNETPDSFASDFAAEHGPCCTGFSLRVNNPNEAYERTRANGAKDVEHRRDTLAVDVPCISGIGGSVLYLTGSKEDYEKEFDFSSSVERNPEGVGLTFIDHLTHNLFFGNMGEVGDYYERLFGFREIRYFDIKGARPAWCPRP